jgi:GNAT superfamily N-acetyltransferase
MIITNLKNNTSLYYETLALIEESFGYDKPFKFDIDFYPLMEEKNWHNNYLILEKNTCTVLGHIGVNLKFLKNQYSKTPIALIGGISIHKDYRNQGLFKLLMNYVLEQYKKKVSLFILWSDLKDLYNKFDFFEAGSTIQTGNYNLTEESIKDSSFTKTRLGNLTSHDIKIIKSIYENYTKKHMTSLERNWNQWNTLKKINSSDLYLYKIKGKIVGYFFAHKGFDLQNIIHEYAVLEKFKDQFFHVLMPYKLWVPENFYINHREIKKNFLAFFKIGSENFFSSFIEDWTQKKIKINSIGKNNVIYTSKNKTYTQSIESFLIFLFGPHQTNNFSHPLYFSGLESI